MSVTNAEIADILERVGDILEVRNANTFRVRAYHNAARTVSGLTESVAAMVKRGDDPADLPAIGRDLAGKITEIVRTGRLEFLQELEQETPPGLLDLLNVPGLGPKRVEALHEALGIDSLKGLAEAAGNKRIREVPGFGAKTEQNILEALNKLGSGSSERLRRDEAVAIAEPLLAYLAETRGIGNACIAGSYRRCRETVGDLDILVTGKSDCPVMERLVAYGDVDRVVSRGSTRATVILRNGCQVDLRLVPKASFGAALHYFTGSRAHNIAIRSLGADAGLRINEYGVFRDDRRVAGRTEKEVYKSVGLPYIEPELRENRGEIEAARERSLPKLVGVDDICGDLHVHTSAGQGKGTIREMVKAARKRGYTYLAVTDIHRRDGKAGGPDTGHLRRQIGEIDRLNARLKGFTVLKSVEAGILEDGSLDLPDEVLEELDLTVCAVNSGFGLSRKRQTERILRAMDNPLFNILAHPAGRLLGERPPYDVDMERLVEAAKERGCIMEINARPQRLDLNDIHSRMAAEHGVRMAISSDSRSTAELDQMTYGVEQARRGWVEAEHVINTHSLRDLRKVIRR